MGVELQHCAVYGYRLDGSIDYDSMWDSEAGEYTDQYERLMGYRNHEAEEGDFIIFEDPRADRYFVAGIVHFLTPSVRWEGPPNIEPTVMEDPAPALVEAMEDTIDAELTSLGIERETDEPEHIVFTHNH